MGTDLFIRFIGMDLVSRVAERAGNSVDRLDNRVRRAGGLSAQALNAAGIAATTFGISMLAAAGAVAAFGVHAVETFAQFQSDVIMASTHAGLLPSQIGEVSKALLAMAPAVGFGPDALAQAFYHVQSASTSLSPQMQNLAAKEDILRQAAELAAIGHANLTDTTNALISVLTSYKGMNLSAAGAAAQLNTIVGEGNMTMQQLASALANGLLPVAADAGVKLNSVGAALATLTDLGISSSRAATYVRSAIIQMTTPTATAAKALEAIGLSGQQSMEQIGAWSDVLNKAGVSQTVVAAELQKSGSLAYVINNVLMPALEKSGLHSQQASALIEKAFGGIRSGTGILGLTDNLSGLIQKENDAGDATKKWAQTWDQFRTTDPTFVINQMKASWQTLEVTLGGALMPIMVQLNQILVPLIQRFTQWADAHPALLRQIIEGTIVVLGLVGAMLTLGGLMMVMAGSFGVMGGIVRGLTGNLGELLFGYAALTKDGKVIEAGSDGVLGAFKRLSKGGADLGKAVAEGLLKPVRYVKEFGLEAVKLIPGMGMVRSAIDLLGGGLLRVAGNLLALPGFIRAVGGLMGTVFRNLPQLLMAGIKNLPGLLMGGLKSVPGLLVGALRALPGLLMGAFEGVLPLIGTVVGALLPFLAIIAAVAAVAAIVGVAIHDHWGQIVSTIKKVAGAFHTALDVLVKTRNPLAAFQALLKALGLSGGQVSGAMNLLHKVMTLLQTAFNAAVNLARRFWADLAQGLSKIHGAHQALQYLGVALKVVGAVLGVVGLILAALLGGVFKALLGFLSTALPTAIQLAINIINFWGDVFKTIVRVAQDVWAIFDDIFHGRWGKLWGDVKRLFSDTWNGVGKIFGDGVTLVKDLFTGLWNTVKRTVSDFVTGVIDAFHHLWDILVGHSIVPDTINAIVKWFTGLPGKILGLLRGMVGDVGRAAQSIGSAIQNGIVGALSGLGGALSGAIKGALGAIPGGGLLLSALHGKIPGFASGGLVTSPTLAMVGEAGPELIVPLRAISNGPSAARFMPALAPISGAVGGSSDRQTEKVAEALKQIAQVLARAASKEGNGSVERLLRSIDDHLEAIRGDSGGIGASSAVLRFGT